MTAPAQWRGLFSGYLSAKGYFGMTAKGTDEVGFQTSIATPRINNFPFGFAMCVIQKDYTVVG